MPEIRQLAAIVFSDISGFTNTMESDEDRAMAHIQKHREIITNVISEFHGEILKEMGDGILLKFTSAIEAVRCANKIQEQAETEEFKLRIGMHLGDVIMKDNDIFGSGVNIASRIHEHGDPDSICISNEIWLQIKNQSGLSAESLGTKELKGVKEPVEIFKLLSETSTETVQDAATSEHPQYTLIADLMDRKFPHILGGYGLLCWVIASIVSYFVNKTLMSPHLINLAISGMLSFIPSICLLAYFHGKKGLKDFNKIEKIGIPVNIFTSILILFIVFYPKDLGAITETVSCEDELGNRIDKVVPKSEFRKKIAIFYFENETGDSTLNWLRYGLPWLCKADLEQDFYISYITQDYFDYKIENAGYSRTDKLPLSLKKKVSNTLNKNYFLEGSINVIDDTYSITTKLYKTENGNLINENNYVESNIFTLTDKLVKQLKMDLGIPLHYLETSTDLPVQSITTDNERALAYNINGELEWEDDNYDTAFQLINHALDNDKYFLQAHKNLSMLKMNNLQDASWEEHWDIILKSIDKLTDRTKFNYKMVYYSLTGDEVLYKKLALRQVTLYPSDIEAHNNLAGVYYQENNPERFDNSLREYKIILQLDPERYEYYQKIGRLYKEMTQYDSSIYYYKKYTEAVPEDNDAYSSLANGYAKNGKISDAISAMQTGMVLGNKEMWMETQILWYKKSLNMDTSIDIINDLNNLLTLSNNYNDSLRIYYQLEWAYHLFGQVKTAIDYSNLVKSYNTSKYGLYQAIFPIVKYDVELYIQSGLKDVYKQHLIFIENNAISPDDNIIPYFYSKYYLYTENFDMLAATIDAAEESYGNY